MIKTLHILIWVNKFTESYSPKKYLEEVNKPVIATASICISLYIKSNRCTYLPFLTKHVSGAISTQTSRTGSQIACKLLFQYTLRLSLVYVRLLNWKSSRFLIWWIVVNIHLYLSKWLSLIQSGLLVQCRLQMFFNI